MTAVASNTAFVDNVQGISHLRIKETNGHVYIETKRMLQKNPLQNFMILLTIRKRNCISQNTTPNLHLLANFRRHLRHVARSRAVQEAQSERDHVQTHRHEGEYVATVHVAASVKRAAEMIRLQHCVRVVAVCHLRRDGKNDSSYEEQESNQNIHQSLNAHLRAARQLQGLHSNSVPQSVQPAAVAHQDDEQCTRNEREHDRHCDVAAAEQRRSVVGLEHGVCDGQHSVNKALVQHLWPARGQLEHPQNHDVVEAAHRSRVTRDVREDGGPAAELTRRKLDRPERQEDHRDNRTHDLERADDDASRRNESCSHDGVTLRMLWRSGRGGAKSRMAAPHWQQGRPDLLNADSLTSLEREMQQLLPRLSSSRNDLLDTRGAQRHSI
ncbi:hypothetical protein ON010_g4094 [Phytophthora cinnamomi]|nr:hypothetical protein ON010_g4094 [Phytophthora cinnamomi]